MPVATMISMWLAEITWNLPATKTLQITVPISRK